jgi:ribosomal-protein-alanine N-acetyltransferase
VDAEAIFSATFPQLQGDDLLLRELNDSDVAALFLQFSDAEVMRYYDLEPFTEPQQAEELMSRWRQRQQRGFGIRWAICHPQRPSELLGTCGFNLWIQNSARAVLGYDLARTYWRQGIMKQAVTLVLNYGFETLSLNRVEAVVFRDNTASCELLKKLGFTHEGLLRQYDNLHGHFEDMHMFSRLRSDPVV